VSERLHLWGTPSEDGGSLPAGTWRVARSYRAAFFLELFETLFAAAGFYFLSRFIESPQLERALPPGTSYFSFALVGLAFFDYLSVALRAFDEGLQDARQTARSSICSSHRPRFQ